MRQVMATLPTFGVANALRAAGHGVNSAMVDSPALRQQVVSEGHEFVPVPLPWLNSDG